MLAGVGRRALGALGTVATSRTRGRRVCVRLARAHGVRAFAHSRKCIARVRRRRSLARALARAQAFTQGVHSHAMLAGTSTGRSIFLFAGRAQHMQQDRLHWRWQHG